MSKKPRHLRVVGGQSLSNTSTPASAPRNEFLTFSDLPMIAEETDDMHAMILQFRMAQSMMPMSEAGAELLMPVMQHWKEGNLIVERYESLLQSWLTEPKMASKRNELEAILLKLDEVRALLTDSIATLVIDINSSNTQRAGKTKSPASNRVEDENVFSDRNNRKTRPPVKLAHVKNVVASANRMSFEMWDSLDDLLEKKSELDSFRFGLETVVDAIESVCIDQGTSAHGMKAPSRLSFFWMKFLLLENNLVDHINALRIARYTALEEALAVEVHLANSPRRYYSFTKEADRIVIKANECFIHADRDVWLNFMRFCKNGDAAAKRVVLDYLETDQCNRVLRNLTTMMCGCGERHGD